MARCSETLGGYTFTYSLTANTLDGAEVHVSLSPTLLPSALAFQPPPLNEQVLSEGGWKVKEQGGRQRNKKER